MSFYFNKLKESIQVSKSQESYANFNRQFNTELLNTELLNMKHIFYHSNCNSIPLKLQTKNNIKFSFRINTKTSFGILNTPTPKYTVMLFKSLRQAHQTFSGHALSKLSKINSRDIFEYSNKLPNEIIMYKVSTSPYINQTQCQMRLFNNINKNFYATIHYHPYHSMFDTTSQYDKFVKFRLDTLYISNDTTHDLVFISLIITPMTPTSNIDSNMNDKPWYFTINATGQYKPVQSGFYLQNNNYFSIIGKATTFTTYDLSSKNIYYVTRKVKYKDVTVYELEQSDCDSLREFLMNGIDVNHLDKGCNITPNISKKLKEHIEKSIN